MTQPTIETQTHLQSFHFPYLISILQVYLYFINNLFKKKGQATFLFLVLSEKREHF